MLRGNEFPGVRKKLLATILQFFLGVISDMESGL